MVTHHVSHLKSEKLRKEWNKAAHLEQRRQDTALSVMRCRVEAKEEASEEAWFLVKELVCYQL